MSATNDNRTLGRMDLMSIAVGQIIGSGVMVMSISALGMTGRSVNIAFVIAAVLTIFNSLPYIFMGSTIRVLGGYYSQAAIFVGGPFAGFYAFVSIFSGMSMAMYATGLASYLGSLIPVVANNQMIFAVIIFVAFTILNFFGTEVIAKAQNFMFYLLQCECWKCWCRCEPSGIIRACWRCLSLNNLCVRYRDCCELKCSC